MTGKPVVRTVEIVNERGLHARASAKFVKTAGRKYCTIASRVLTGK